jgi:cation diffusion facilitator CzcD-associated flavoprotein CzcO
LLADLTHGKDEPTRTLDAVIIGAGFAGLYMLYRLRSQGRRALLFEAGSGVGGTWFWNRYPGARCDIESLQYSYSFDPDLEQEWSWSERYASQPEILRYLNHVADRFDLRRDIVLDTRVESAQWEERTLRWNIRTDQGHSVSARFCITAVGNLSVPKTPDIEGVEQFSGQIYNTAQWPEEDVDFSGQRVGVIGTGSSGIQIIPILARQADELKVFQRSANFSLPAVNRPLDPETANDYKSKYRQMRERARYSRFGITSAIVPEPSALAIDAEERDRVFEHAWQTGGNALPGAYIDVSTDMSANELAAEFVRSKIRQKVNDPKTAEVLSPRDHPIFGRRPCIDIEYYETFNRDNVHLVDLRASPIERFCPKGIRTSAELHQLDSVVFATGFDAITGALLRIDVRGTESTTLKSKWADGPRAYLGLMTSGFPNLLMITGPGSPSVISNVVVSIEQHVDWICDLLAHMRHNGSVRVEASREAEDAWVDTVNEVANMTVMSKTPSWYSGDNVPGKPQVFMPYVGGVGQYRRICEKVSQRDYEGFRFS